MSLLVKKLLPLPATFTFYSKLTMQTTLRVKSKSPSISLIQVACMNHLPDTFGFDTAISYAIQT